jgi:hypothetical protein
MKRCLFYKSVQQMCILMAITALVLVGTISYGQQYSIDWSTIDGGGGMSSAGSYSLTGTIGQPDADYSAGGPYEVFGGFWAYKPTCWSAVDAA